MTSTITCRARPHGLNSKALHPPLTITLYMALELVASGASLVNLNRGFARPAKTLLLITRIKLLTASLPLHSDL